MTIKTTPSGFLALATFILAQLNWVPDPKAIPQFRLDDFAKEQETFLEKFVKKSH